jgi:hypothetical protein
MMEVREKSIGLDGKVFAERRAGQRRRVLKGAVMTFNKGYSAFECVVRNQSGSGAKLSLGETFALPNRFRLAITGEDDGHMAEVVWRSLSEMGVRYADELAEEPPQAA